MIDKDHSNFVVKLSTYDYREMTADDRLMIFDYIESDGCSVVPDFYKSCCIYHDFWYATHIDFDLTPISRAEADKRFRKCIQSKSVFGFFSPMSWWRYAGVRMFGSRPWKE